MANRRRSIKLWLAVALILRLFYLREQSAVSPLFDQLGLDELEVAQTAQALINGTVDQIPLYKAPFYSWYLACIMKISGNSWFFFARLGQHLAGVILIWMASDCLRLMLKNRKVEVRNVFVTLLAAFLAIYAPLIRLENRLVLDFWTVFFQSGLLWALFRWVYQNAEARKWIFFAGLFTVLAWLNRPTITVVFPFLVGWVLWKARPSKPVLSVMVFILPVLFGVMGLGYRNHLVSGARLLLPWQGGYDLWMSNGPQANGKYLVQPTYVDSRTANPSFELSQSGFETAVELGEVDPPPTGHYFKSLNKYWVGKTIQRVKEQPWDWMALYIRKALYLLNHEEIYSFESYEVQKQISPLLKWFPPLGFGFIFPFALTGWMWWKQRKGDEKSYFAVLWIYAVTLSAATALYYASGRMRMPLIFPALLLAFESLAIFTEGWKIPQHKPSRVSLFFGIVLLGIICSWGDWWGVRSEEFRDREYLRISRAYYAKGQVDQALRYAERAELINPDYPLLPLMKGQALYALGRYQEAAGSFKESMIKLPDAWEASYNFGVINWYYLDEPEAALEAFRLVLTRNPDHQQATALASIAEGLYGNLDESDRLLENARKIASSEKSMVLWVAEIANLKRHQLNQEVNVMLKDLWEKFSTDDERSMLMDDLKRANVF